MVQPSQTHGTKRTLFGKLAEKPGIPSPFFIQMGLIPRNVAAPNFCPSPTLYRCKALLALSCRHQQAGPPYQVSWREAEKRK